MVEKQLDLPFSPDGLIDRPISESENYLSERWQRALRDTTLPLHTYLQLLSSKGVSSAVIQKLVNTLWSTGVDVSDPFASSSELSVMLLVSESLLGQDLSGYRWEADQVLVSELSSPRPTGPITPPQVSHSVTENYREILGYRQAATEAVLSSGDYREIAKESLLANNGVFSDVATRVVHEVVGSAGIGVDGVVYFRDLKTFAGDVDFYYWGPLKKDVEVGLAKQLTLLGFKVDHRSHALIDSLLGGDEKIASGFLGAYLHWFFMMGKSINLGENRFLDRYEEGVLPRLDLASVWPSVHKSIYPALGVLEDVYFTKQDQFPGFKELSFRLLTAVSMGLSIAHDVPFVLDYEGFLDNLGPHMSTEEVDVLRSAFYYINQVRNLYQLATERRWEMVSQKAIDSINGVIVHQDGASVADGMRQIARDLRAIADKHLGTPETNSFPDLTASQNGSVEQQALKKAYAQVADRYRMMMER